MFICGSGNFGHQEEEKYERPCTTPKRSKKSTVFCKIIGKDYRNKNPYANRGLDTFNALLADLQDKKQQIYTQMGPDHISFMRFVYTNDSKRVKPIIVKVKEKGTQDMNSPRDTIMNHTGVIKIVPTVTRDMTQIYSSELEDLRSQVQGEETRGKNGTSKRFMRYNAGFKLHGLRQPGYYVPMVIVSILLFLAIFGRSFAILCTSIIWYLIPMIGGSSLSSTTSSSKRKLKTLNKEHVQKESKKEVMKSEGPSSPTSVLTKR